MTWLIWSVQVRMSFMTTPSSLKHRTCSMPQSFNDSWRGGGTTLALGEHISMHLVLLVFSFSPLLLIQVLALSRQDWRDYSRSSNNSVWRKGRWYVESSAKRTVQTGERTYVRSLINTEKRLDQGQNLEAHRM